MIKRTPQEIADFTGCYIAQDFDGSWMAYEIKPTMNKTKRYWILKDSVGAMLIIHSNMLDIPEDHDWMHLYEPQNITQKSEDINAESGENRQKLDLCPHQSEVYVQKEYRIVQALSVEGLAAKVANMMENGWKLQGGVSAQPLNDADDNLHTFHQAMVRGV